MTLTVSRADSSIALQDEKIKQARANGARTTHLVSAQVLIEYIIKRRMSESVLGLWSIIQGATRSAKMICEKRMRKRMRMYIPCGSSSDKKYTTWASKNATGYLQGE